MFAAPTTSCEKTPLTTSGKLEVCFALDESGSICTNKWRAVAKACTGTASHRTTSYDVNYCEYNGLSDKKHPKYCPRFNTNTKDFVRGLILQMDSSASDRGVTVRYAVATFSSKADADQGLAGTNTTRNTIDSLEYKGGLTQTAEGLEKCQEALQDGEVDADKLIVLITDGRPRKNPSDSSSYLNTTKNYAANIKSGQEASGGGSAPEMAIFVETVESDLSFVQQLASPGLSFEFSDGYEALDGKIDDIVNATLKAGEKNATLESSCGGKRNPPAAAGIGTLTNSSNTGSDPSPAAAATIDALVAAFALIVGFAAC